MAATPEAATLSGCDGKPERGCEARTTAIFGQDQRGRRLFPAPEMSRFFNVAHFVEFRPGEIKIGSFKARLTYCASCTRQNLYLRAAARKVCWNGPNHQIASVANTALYQNMQWSSTRYKHNYNFNNFVNLLEVPL